MDSEPQLARRIGLPLLTFYGLGTILGAGIYVLVGKVAAASGLLAPMAFLVAAFVAGVTAMSYCQLVMKFPKSAGEAYYVEQGFNLPALTSTVGYLVVFTGIVSAATLANGFVGYLGSFIDIPHNLAITLVVVIMGTIAFWGIAESLWLAAVITIIELSGLCLVVFYGGSSLEGISERWSDLVIPVSGMEISLVLSGAFLAFYAFIGFEDMVNVVEEVKEPAHTMPKAIILAVVISTLLYFLVAVVAVLDMPLDKLAGSGAPLKELLEQQNPVAGQWIGVISLFAIVNGVLTQIIMASRVLYGMANQGRSPKAFAKVSARTKTPWLSTLVVGCLILTFALWLPLVTLAKTTSFIILMIFTLVNLALWYLIKTERIEKDSQLPCWPKFGALLCLGLLTFQINNLLN